MISPLRRPLAFRFRRCAAQFALLTLGLFAANLPAQPASAPARGAKPFRAGAAISNITPQLGVSMEGIIAQKGRINHIRDELHARCLVLDDGATRLAFIVCDTTMIDTAVVDRIKRTIADETGIAPSHVVITATHSHNTPRPSVSLPLGALNDAYNEFFVRRIADGVRRAVNNLADAQIGWGSTDRPDFIQNRRWHLAPEHMPENPFGTKTDQVAVNAAPVLRLKPSGPVDPAISVLAVRHADGRPLAVLASYGLHFVGGIEFDVASADYYGVFADELSRLLAPGQQDPAFVAIMANGTSGDINFPDVPDRSIAPARGVRLARLKEMAKVIARDVQRVYQSLEFTNHAPLAATTSTLELGVRKPDAERLEWAKRTLAARTAGAPITRPQIYAREAELLAQHPETVSIPLQALQIGDLGIASIPCEVFAITGLTIKRESPFKATFVLELANGYYGYLPTPDQHQLGGYETWPARSSFLATEAEPKIRTEALRLLTRLPQR